jgi:hypothetical protein
VERLPPFTQIVPKGPAVVRPDQEIQHVVDGPAVS